MAIWKLGGLALAAVLGSALLTGPASAMPANGLATVASKVTNGVEQVRLVCGPYRCWHRYGWHRWGWNRWGYRPLYAYAGPGWNRWSMRRPLYAYAGGPGWNRWGMRRPLYAYAGPGWNRPLYAAAAIATGVGFASAAWDSGWYGGWDGGWGGGGPYYGYGGPAWNVGWNTGWNGGWGWRRNWW
jgi:hypothetical protein